MFPRVVGLVVLFVLLAAGLTFLFPHNNNNNNNCEDVKRAHDAWLHREPIRDRAELREEIMALLQDNACDGVTPLVLRKVLLDMEAVR